MARPKKNLEQQPDVEETGLVYTEPEEVIYTIYDKYDKYIKQLDSGYLLGLNYQEAMEILRYCENKMNINIPLNMSCGVCLMDLIKMFKRIKDK